MRVSRDVAIALMTLVWVCAGACQLPAFADSSGADLLAGFRDPPKAARPAVYWAWVNGLTNKKQMTWELEELSEKGIRGVYIFDIGARDPYGIVPTGPAFMGPESLDAIAYAVKEATRLGLDVGLVTSSSWNCGGPWITPEHASMGLYHCQLTVEGPGRLSEPLPMPKVPAAAPRGLDGEPAYLKNVAVLAVPSPKRLPGHEFVIELAPPGIHRIDRVVLYNTESEAPGRYGSMHLFTKDFQVAVSTTTADAEAFHTILDGTLKPRTGAQSFQFIPVQAKYVKLLVLSGYNTKFDRVELGECEAYSTDGLNAAMAYNADGSKTAASLIRYSSALGTENEWTADNIHDGAKSGAAGSWSSAGPPPLIIDDPEKIVDLTDRIDSDGRLDWDIPPGKWTIMRFICANTGATLRLPSPKSGGLSIDHFSREATLVHFDYLLNLLHRKLGSFAGTALKQMYVCSYEVSSAIWTPDFLAQFQKYRGYPMTKYLPVLAGCIVRDGEHTARFTYDYRKTLGDLLVDAFYKTATEASNADGLQLCAEAGGPGPPLHQVPVDALKALGTLDIPRGEFWKDHNVWVVKETACAAHIYGKPLVDMEAFTSWRHWQDGPFELKGIADRAFCGGANHFTFHTCAHNPTPSDRPGWVYHAGTHINPSLVWWPKAKPWIDYVSRCSYMLQQGLFTADVCYYYGDQGYNFVPPKHIDPSLGFGYDYDVTNAEVLLTQMDVKDGRVTLPDGLSYGLLVLPERDDIDLAVLKKIEQLVRKGATIVGPKPTRSNGLADAERRDKAVREIADRLWGPCDGRTCTERTYGRGTVIWGKSLREVLNSRGIGPDFTSLSEDSDVQYPLDYIHRRSGDVEIYFVANKLDRWERTPCIFRVSGKVPTLWRPDTGQVQACEFERTPDGGTRVDLTLAPYGSVFVVFGAEGIEAGPVPEKLVVLKEITGPWEVRFPAGWGAPSVVTLPELISWTDANDAGIKYFSGIGTYQKEFNLPADSMQTGGKLVLDLGRVRFVAEAFVNGRSAGVVWKPPFQVDVTDLVKPGPNQLRVEVANTWSNRLVGDALSPPDRRFCRTNIDKSLTWEAPWKDTPLLESGLLGPVRILTKSK